LKDVKKLLIILLLLGLASDALNCVSKRGGPYTIEVSGEKYTCWSFDGIEPFHHFWGIYKYPHDSLAGINLYLFPDYRFLYTQWCDVCEEKVIAQGSFRFANGKILLQQTHVEPKFKDKIKQTSFNVLYGYIEKKHYVTRSLSLLITDDKLRRIQSSKREFEGMIRSAELPDWQQIHDYLIIPRKKPPNQPPAADAKKRRG
jgi:hypothetical protein